MMSSKYRVIWIDDEWDEQIPFITWCMKKHKIEIIPFKTSKDGMIALESNINSWDAIILDVEVYNETENEVACPKGFQNSINKISSLENKRKVPYFISTGKDAVKNNQLFLSQYDKVYIKGDGDDELIANLMIQADAQLETQIKHNYSNIIGTFEEIDSELIKILIELHNGITDDSNILNAIRKILEWVMPYCIRCGVLQIEWKGANISECSGFLGKKQMLEFVPIHIQRSIHSLSDITNPGSHRSIVDKMVGGGTAPYLLRSTVFELLNILYWCKSLPRDADSIKAIHTKVRSIKYHYSK